MKIPRVVAMDIDGTLIGSDKKVPAFTASEVRRVVEESGAHIVLITARGPQSTAMIEEQLGVLASFVTYGGALVWARADGGAFTVLSESPLETERVRAMTALAERHPVHVGIYGSAEWHVNSMNYWGMREARNTSVWPSSVGDLEAAAAGGPFYKVMFRGERDALDEVEGVVRDAMEGLFVHRFKHVLEITPAAAVKLPALTFLVDHLGYNLDDVIAFGDSGSDIEMLENVGLGVLMANAADNIPVAAHLERTLSNDEDGVGVALRKFFPTSQPFHT